MEKKIYLVQVVSGGCGYEFDEVYIIKAEYPEQAAQDKVLDNFKHHDYCSIYVYDFENLANHTNLPIQLSDAVETYSWKICK